MCPSTCNSPPKSMLEQSKIKEIWFSVLKFLFHRAPAAMQMWITSDAHSIDWQEMVIE